MSVVVGGAQHRHMWSARLGNKTSTAHSGDTALAG
jgi:hypothetical protein